MTAPRNLTKSTGVSIPVSRELLDDLDSFDIWTSRLHPPSPLGLALIELEEAQAALEAAQERYDALAATPGSDVRPEPFTLNDALRDAIAVRVDTP